MGRSRSEFLRESLQTHHASRLGRVEDFEEENELPVNLEPDTSDQSSSLTRTTTATTSSTTNETTSSSSNALWYTASVTRDIKPPPLQRQILNRLLRFRGLIRACEADESAAAKREEAFERLREELHELPFVLVKEWPLKISKVLDTTYGLPSIFDERFSKVKFPFDVVTDAKQLFRRWADKKFNTTILEGITWSTTETSQGDGTNDRSKSKQSRQRYPSILPQYSNHHTYRTIGSNGLVNGQWWPLQMCMVRDGAHGSSRAGIHGLTGSGALSIVLSSGYMYDRDEGDNVWYAGTLGKDGKVSEATRYMIKSAETGQPIRVFRSARCASRFRPTHGVRYDGLYAVVDYHEATSSRRHTIFHLRRKENQDPIRYKGPEMRPTPQEIQAYDNERLLR